MSQPIEAGTENEQEFGSRCRYFIVAFVAGAITAVLLVIDASHPNVINDELIDLTRALTILAGCGWLVRSAESRVMRRIDREYDEAYADGFTDGAAGIPKQSSSRLRSVKVN